MKSDPEVLRAHLQLVPDLVRPAAVEGAPGGARVCIEPMQVDLAGAYVSSVTQSSHLYTHLGDGPNLRTGSRRGCLPPSMTVLSCGFLAYRRECSTAVFSITQRTPRRSMKDCMLSSRGLVTWRAARCRRRAGQVQHV